jgi:hypothetical protein
MTKNKPAVIVDSEHPICEHAIEALQEVAAKSERKTGFIQSLVPALTIVLRSPAAEQADGFTLLSATFGQQALRLPFRSSDNPESRFIDDAAREIWTIGARRAIGRNRGTANLAKILNAWDSWIQKQEPTFDKAGTPQRAAEEMQRQLSLLSGLSQIQLRRSLAQRRAQMAQSVRAL